jgi:Superfamily I DNA and RNA helicases and helicase subunits
LEFNRLNNRVTYRDLLHQVTKKKKIWPIRKVIGEFENEVYKLLPCWLASPESVSALFPLKESFDLVIFDEASQCFAERGIPSLYRGKQAIIAGDSKQLRPGDFYQVRWQEEDHDPEPDLEVDSLLELSSRYWPTVQLCGHYRSQATELIHFSNRNFYEGRLQLLPDFKMDRGNPPIEYLKVDGVWEENTNHPEAIAVSECVQALLAKTPELEIGVVTFNAPQQMLIMDILEEAFGKENKVLPSSLFVKNIENVQGDERDVIIFSVGYAPDKHGKVKAQFGSLNQAGGENRLNVAITRARRRIIVITSLWPHQLETSETKNEGPRLFKEYLNFAKDVSDQKFVATDFSQRGHDQCWYLKSRIVSWAKQKWAESEVEDADMPFYDLMVKQKGEPRGVLLSDDEFYYQALSARAPHGLPPLLLDQKNWPFLRVHSRNYWQDRERFFNEVSKLFV